MILVGILWRIEGLFGFNMTSGRAQSGGVEFTNLLKDLKAQEQLMCKCIYYRIIETQLANVMG